MVSVALGVIEVPYADNPSVTTGDVAEWLENKYAVMATFVDYHLDVIEDAVAEHFADKVDMLMNGAPIDAVGDIQFLAEPQVAFNEFIDNNEMDGIAGIPTRAAQDGINSRFKSGKGPPRPSFRETGAYEGAFRAWVEE